MKKRKSSYGSGHFPKLPPGAFEVQELFQRRVGNTPIHRSLGHFRCTRQEMAAHVEKLNTERLRGEPAYAWRRRAVIFVIDGFHNTAYIINITPLKLKYLPDGEGESIMNIKSLDDTGNPAGVSESLLKGVSKLPVNSLANTQHDPEREVPPIAKERDWRSHRLDLHLIRKALEAYKSGLDMTTVDGMLTANRVTMQLESMAIREHWYELLMKVGGAWLGGVHSWIQHKCMNGSEVTWGSQQELRRNAAWTVRDLEEIAAHAAAAAINEYKGLQ